MDPCAGVSGKITQYQISFQTGSVVVTDIARCTAGRCSHTFEPPSNPPSSYDSVSVAAENVVGVGAARNCTTQPISELKFAMFHFENTETSPVFVLWKGILSICTPTANLKDVGRCLKSWFKVYSYLFSLEVIRMKPVKFFSFFLYRHN